MERKQFVSNLSILAAGACLAKNAAGSFFYEGDESPLLNTCNPLVVPYLFTASQGGKYMTASSFIFKIV